ncbi:hypothetical protein LINPERPRIM_LOCUS7867 [Linum perenne]
MFVISRVLS